MPIDFFERREAENIEDTKLSTNKFDDINLRGGLVYPIEDFTEACNNQEIDLDKYWVSYIVN